MSANNLAMNIGKFDGANYNKWSGQVELLLESKHVLGIVTGDLKKPEALAENASATERLAHATLMESYVDKHGTARSTLTRHRPTLYYHCTTVIPAIISPPR
ncbi:hypothetical protein K440DRAFT_678865 [Wilcoxina mikolae CBS 423.85]|nr:hypothetical protein K440DRAFT_678865 [Wilcoxina mikolae CBS 423.85]